MDFQYILPVIIWILILQGIGILTYPICFGLFNRLPDHGYAAAKFLGILFSAYLCWLLASVGPLTSWAEFGPISALLSLGVTACIGVVYFTMNARLIVRRTVESRKTLLCVEVAFWGLFILMLALRSRLPQVIHLINDSAAEKFTDFAVLNGLLCSPIMPPQDAWVSGMPLNYYYFGHFLWAFMIKCSEVLPEVGFNLALCSVGGLIAALTFSLGVAIGRRNRWGFFAVLAVIICGNADSFFLAMGHLLGSDRSAYDFWLPSRAVTNCITEFPAFSLILGDLHAHLLNMPVVLTALLLGVDFYRTRACYSSIVGYLSNHLSTVLVAALLMGAASAANSWDVAVIGACFALCVWLACPEEADAGPRHPMENLILRIPPALGALAGIGILAYFATSILFAPFRNNFTPPFDGFPVLPNLPENRTAVTEFLAHWGLFLTPVFAWLLWIGLHSDKKMRFGSIHERTVVLSLGGALAAVSLTMGGGLTASLLLTVGCGLLYILLTRDLFPQIRLMLGFLLMICVFGFLCEVVHVDDIFEGANERINTVFKLYYGLWPIACAAALIALCECPARWRIALMSMMLFAGAFYTPLSVMARFKMTTRPPVSAIGMPLDGLSYLQEYEPGDLAAIRWIRDNVPTTDRILEIPGTQYTYAGRISTCTGRPALGGWLYHSWAWRGNSRFGAERDRRTSESQAVYNTSDSGVARRLLEKNDIRWVIVGPEERDKCPDLQEEKFSVIGTEAFRSGETSVYQLNR